MNNILHSEYFVENDGYLYFSDADHNGLYRSRISDWETEFLGFFPGEPTRKRFIHYQVILKEGVLLFSAQNSKGFHMYNIADNNFYMCENLGTFDNYGYLSLACAGGKIIMPPFQADQLLVYDLDSLKQKGTTNKSLSINAKITHAVGCMNDYVYLASTEDDNCILRVDSRNEEIIRNPIKCYRDGFEWMVCLDNKLILSSRKTGTLYKYDTNNDAFSLVYDIQNAKIESLVELDDSIFVVYGGMNDILMLDKRDEKITNKMINGQNFLKDKEYHFGYGHSLNDGRVALMLRYDMDGTFALIDPTTLNVECVRINRPIPERDYNLFISEDVVNNTSGIMQEEYKNDFLNYISFVAEEETNE